MYLFTVVASWTSATDVSELDPKHIADASWQAAVVEHGKAREWSRGTVRQNPIGFTLYSAGLIVRMGSAGLMSLLSFRAHKAEKKVRS